MNSLSEDLVVPFDDVRMLSRSSQDTTDTQPFAKRLSVVESESTFLVNDESVRRSPDLHPYLVELCAQFLFGFVSQYADCTPASSLIYQMKNNEVQYE